MPHLSTMLRTGVCVYTTDATVTTVATIDTAIFSNQMMIIEAHVIGQKDDYASGGAYCIRGLFKNNGGTLTQIGSTTTVGTAIESDSSWDATMTTSGTNVLIQVTGAAATNIVWRCDAYMQRVGYLAANNV